MYVIVFIEPAIGLSGSNDALEALCESLTLINCVTPARTGMMIARMIPMIDADAIALVRVKLDTENYRARREETLRHLAKNIAHKVKRTRRPVALEPMNPYERRIIHSALQSDPYVTTHSEGEEPYRKVVVTLKR